MKNPLRVLIVEDSELDARVLLALLRQGGFEPAHKRVDTAEDMHQALDKQTWDIILADYNMPNFSAPAALKLLQEKQLDVPFIIVSGGIGEDVAVGVMKSGANDYLMKGNLARLAPAVNRELRDAADRAARRQAEQSLRDSEQRYRMLWENSTDAVLLTDADSNIQFANPAVEKVFGFKPEEVVGQNLTLLLPDRVRPDNQPSFAYLLHSGVKTSKRPVVETVGRNKANNEVLVEIAFNDIELQGLRWYVAFIRDITERKRAEQELREHEEQFRVAREIQQHLFPKSAPQLPGYDLAGITIPAEAAGGDYFDYLPLQQDGLGLVVGDVTGHGIGPALLMAETRAYLRILGLNRAEVGDILTRANRALADDVGAERFVTMLLARLDAAERKLTYASAGHPPGYIVGADGQVRKHLRRTGIPLGRKPDTVYQAPESTLLMTGDIVFLPTDGIEEAISRDDEFFGTDRTLEVIRANRKLSAAEMVHVLHQAIREFCRGEEQQDDFTAIVLKVL
jgi:sigma-B regulation protein RsbU (phosphoserine phosphatase)